MKKFYFALDTVLNYKEQVLDELKAEHARILGKVVACERLIQDLEDEYLSRSLKLREEQAKGMRVSEIYAVENYLDALRMRIRREKERLATLRRQEEAKRSEVVKAKQETSTIDKLKEKRRQEYDKEAQKQDEQFIEEFVTTQKAMDKLLK